MKRDISSQTKKLIYIICVVVTVALSYGFMLTHISMGIDDEAYDRYFTQNEFAAQGRVGYLLIRPLLDIYTFTPVWKETFGIILFVGVIGLCVYLFREISHNEISWISLTIFSLISLSFSIISEKFIFTGCVTATPFEWILCVAAICALVKAQIAANKKSFWKRYALGILLFSFALLFEKALVIFIITIAFQAAIVMQIFKKSMGYNNSKTMFQLLKLLVVAVIFSFILSLAGTKLVLNAINLEYVPYVEGYIKYDWHDLWGSFSNCFLELRQFFIESAKQNEAIRMFLIVYAGLLFSGIATAFATRNIWLALCVLGYCAIPFLPYFITGNPYLPLRIMDFWSVWVGFAFGAIYLFFSILLKNAHLKAYASYLMIMLCALCVIKQSYSMTQVFMIKYQKYQKDVCRMERIIYDVEALVGSPIDRPVLFLGLFPVNKEVMQNEMAGRSIFNHDRIFSPDSEIISGRIYDFFAEHGYPLNRPKELSYEGSEFQEFQDLARVRVSSLSNYPQEGYIKEYPEYILVRLGQPHYEGFPMSVEAFLEKLNPTNDPVEGNTVYYSEANSISCYGWFSFPNQNNYDTKTSMILLNSDSKMQYIVWLNTVDRPDITAYFNDGYDYSHSGYSRITEITSIVPGTYQIGFYIRSEDKSTVVMQDRFYTISSNEIGYGDVAFPIRRFTPAVIALIRTSSI